MSDHCKNCTNVVSPLDKILEIPSEIIPETEVVNAVTTRSMSKNNNEDEEISASMFHKDIHFDLDDIFFSNAQKADKSLSYLFNSVVSTDDIDKFRVCFFMHNNILMRKYLPPNEMFEDKHLAIKQIVVPIGLRNKILDIAHNTTHFGIRKTINYVRKHFYWPCFKRDVIKYVRSCHSCQMCKKSHIPRFSLKPIEVSGEPFSRLIIDCVGPLPLSKQKNRYIFTVLCPFTRFPEAFPLRNIRTKTILKCLFKYFTMFGLCQEIQSDLGSNFTSKVFKDALKELGIKHVCSSAYHPESQGALERYHKTLKSLLRSFCIENKLSWDENLPLVMYATRHLIQDSLGFSPFQLVFGHNVRGPLDLLKNKIYKDKPISYVQYVSEMQNNLYDSFEKVKSNLVLSQMNMKKFYDKKSKIRSFSIGDRVLVFLPSNDHPFKAKFSGPYEVVKKCSDFNYLVNTTDRRKKFQVFHVNLLQKYFEREEDKQNSVSVINSYVNANDYNVSKDHISFFNSPDYVKDNNAICMESNDIMECNIDNEERNSKTTFVDLQQVLDNFDTELIHLSKEQRRDIKTILIQHKDVCTDQIRSCTLLPYSFAITDSIPIQLPFYRVSPTKREAIRQEVQKLLDSEIISVSTSHYSSPCFTVPKPDGKFRLVIDYRRLNSKIVSDVFPIPRIDDIIDNIAAAKLITTIDLRSGYHQILLDPTCRHLTAFSTPFGLFEFNRIPFGLCGAPSAFQRRMSSLIQGCEEFAAVYIDDLAIFSSNWQDHVHHLNIIFDRMSKFNIVINIKKLKLCCNSVTYLGHTVGNGRVSPITAKIAPIVNFPIPSNKKELMRFLGMVGFFRKFCPRFSSVAAVLTDLLKKDNVFKWSENCDEAFIKLKEFLKTPPVLCGPNFSLPFCIAVDASDGAAGSVLLQMHQNVLHPVAYFSRKFNGAQRNYSTIEKELLSLVLALEHFEIYVSSGRPIQIFTDHNPLIFLNNLKNKNQRLLRWSLRLQKFNLVISHVAGKDNVVADALSRI